MPIGNRSDLSDRRSSRSFSSASAVADRTRDGLVELALDAGGGG